MAQKFSREFQQAVMLVTEDGKHLQIKKIVIHGEIMKCGMNFKEYKNILFCIGFTKAISSVDDNITDNVWILLSK
jgi:hypothetical protein